MGIEIGLKKTAEEDVLCYYIYNKCEFEDYLFINTKLKTTSKYNTWVSGVFEKNGEQYIKST